MKYLLLTLIIFACFACNIPKKDAPKISTEVLDTIKTVPAAIVAQPDFFETAFIKGTTKQGKSAPVNFYGITIGKIKITSGQIVACDPLHIDEYGKPYTQLFPTAYLQYKANEKHNLVLNYGRRIRRPDAEPIAVPAWASES